MTQLETVLNGKIKEHEIGKEILKNYEVYSQ